jgi:acyl carrier protein
VTPSDELYASLVRTTCALLPAFLGRELPGLSADSELLNALGLTSTAALELILRLEMTLGREVEVDEIDEADFATVGSLARYVAANLLEEE